jgi:hypothetical protein
MAVGAVVLESTLGVDRETRSRSHTLVTLELSGGSCPTVSGTLGQLGDGQNRIGDDSLQPAQYCIDDNGAITDSELIEKPGAGATPSSHWS